MRFRCLLFFVCAIGLFFNTRCIGRYTGKGGYKDCAFLSDAASEPIAAQPEIVGAIPLDDSCRFIILMSSGLCSTLHDIYEADTIQVNKEIVQMVVEEFRVQSTLMGVSQATVNKVVQLHHDLYMRQVEEQTPNEPTIIRREDISLLVRNINFPMPNAIQKRSNSFQSSLLDSIPVISQTLDYFYSENSLVNTNSYISTNSSTNSEAFRL